MKDNGDVCFGLMGATMSTGNLGVSALAASVVKNVLIANPSLKVIFLCSERSSESQTVQLRTGTLQVPVINFRMSPRASIHDQLWFIFVLAVVQFFIPFPGLRNAVISANRYLRNVTNCQLIGDIIGGDSFSDIYGFRRLFMISIPLLIAFLLNKKVVLLPQTYGPYSKKISRMVAKGIISRAALVFSRDMQSIRYLQDIGIRKNVQFCPDVAFTLDSICPETCTIEPEADFLHKKPLVGINASGLLFHGGYNKSNMFGLKDSYREILEQVVSAFLEKTGAFLLFVPHTYAPEGNVENDMAACRELYAGCSRRYTERAGILTSEYSQSEVKGIIGKCDFFVGSRMHACIAALSQGIPTIGIAYSKKFLGVFSSINAEQCVLDACKLSKNEITDLVLRRFEERSLFKQQLSGNVSDAQKGVVTAFKNLIEES